MPGSRVRVPPFPTTHSRRQAAAAIGVILRSVIVSRKRVCAWVFWMFAVGLIERGGFGAGPLRSWFPSKNQLHILVWELVPAIQAVLSVSAGR